MTIYDFWRKQMKQNDFYEVDGCTEFIPVTINERYSDVVDVTVHGPIRPFRTTVKQVYQFQKLHDPHKVVVPKFVAEWIEEIKETTDDLSWIWSVYPADHKTRKWLERNTETFMRAWLDGYEVDQEQLYTVEIPNPNLNAHTILQKAEKGLALVVVTNARWRGWADSQLTESEIKEDFEWAWDAGFAKPVEVE